VCWVKLGKIRNVSRMVKLKWKKERGVDVIGNNSVLCFEYRRSRRVCYSKFIQMLNFEPMTHSLTHTCLGNILAIKEVTVSTLLLHLFITSSLLIFTFFRFFHIWDLGQQETCR
jgi:hypothetical protein